MKQPTIGTVVLATGGMLAGWFILEFIVPFLATLPEFAESVWVVLTLGTGRAYVALVAWSGPIFAASLILFTELGNDPQWVISDRIAPATRPTDNSGGAVK